uniref:hypothetical protein n=1 Tax=Parasutterella excrementihominis TaxID=487175 RepID=UPI003FEFE0D4
MKILSALLVPILLLSGCASVTVSNINSQEYLVQRRGDVISQGRLSDPTNTVLTALGLSDCENRVQYCINSVGDSSVTDNESKISALAEMWLFKAMRAQKDAQVLKDAGEIQNEQKLNAELLNDYIQTAKYSVFLRQKNQRPRLRRSTNTGEGLLQLCRTKCHRAALQSD